MNLYPVNLNIHHKLCLVVGGGEVAGRKIQSLINCGARVVVVSPAVTASIEDMAESGEIELNKRHFYPDDLEGAFLVFAVTNDPEVQRHVVNEADKRNILVNIADDPASCSFQVPARVRRGNFLLTVSTGGSSPALAAKLRKDLEEEYGLEYEHFVNLLARIREKVVVDGNTSASHKVLFEKLLQLNILKRIQKEDWAALQHELSSILPEGLDIDELIDSIQPTCIHNPSTDRPPRL